MTDKQKAQVKRRVKKAETGGDRKRTSQILSQLTGKSVNDAIEEDINKKPKTLKRPARRDRH